MKLQIAGAVVAFDAWVMKSKKSKMAQLEYKVITLRSSVLVTSIIVNAKMLPKKSSNS